MNATKVEKCRLTGGELTPVFDLGEPCVSDFLKPGEEGIRAPLCVAVGKEWPYLPQLTHSYPPEQMYKRYHYRSGTNEAMRRELADIVEKARRLRPVDKGDIVCDIACNDLYLLRMWWSWPTAIHWPIRVGIDPSDITRDAAGKWQMAHIVNDFFSKATYDSAIGNQAAVITCIAMFYDLDDPNGFLQDVRACLKDDGLFVLQVSHTPMMLHYNAFDNICHEHLTYWSPNQLIWAVESNGFTVVDAEVTSSNGGSIRLYAMPSDYALRYKKTVEGMAGAERTMLLQIRDRLQIADNHPSIAWTWEELDKRANNIKAETVNFLKVARGAGKKVAGYGASTKGNTLLQYFGIDSDLLPCIADRQEHKHGLVTAGSNIPIISEEAMREMKPDYLFVLPWHFVEGFKEREKELLSSGCRLMTALPEFTVHGA